MSKESMAENKDDDEAETSSNFSNEVLKILKSQSKAMLNMNERIAKLEVITTKQQDAINKLFESKKDINNEE